MDDTAGPGHVPARPRRGPLTTRERRVVAAWAAAPIVVAAVVLTPIAVLGPATGLDVAVAAFVYGGLLALATGFVAHERLVARQCPRCTARNARDAGACAACGFDVATQPRYRCEERHELVLEPGLCSCGRRLHPVEVRGVGREMAAVARAGAWMLGFLVIVGLVLQQLAG